MTPTRIYGTLIILGIKNNDVFANTESKNMDSKCVQNSLTDFNSEYKNKLQ